MNFRPVGMALVCGIALFGAGCSDVDRSESASAGIEINNHDFTPKYDLTGSWISDGDAAHPNHYVQRGREVSCIYDSGTYMHIQHGRFLDDHTLVTLQSRVRLADQTMTRVSMTYVFDSPDRAHLYWVALDDNSDLQKGQTGVVTIVRDRR